MIKLIITRYSTRSKIQAIGLTSMYLDNIDKAKEYVESYYPESKNNSCFTVDYKLIN